MHLPLGAVGLGISDRIESKPDKAWAVTLRRLCCYPTLGFLVWHGAWFVAVGLGLALFLMAAVRHDVKKRGANA